VLLFSIQTLEDVLNFHSKGFYPVLIGNENVIFATIVSTILACFYLLELLMGIAVSPWDPKDTLRRDEKPAQFWFVMIVQGLGFIVLPILGYLLLPERFR